MKSRTTRESWFNVLLVGIAIVVLILLALMVNYVFVGGPELYLGMYIVLGIGVLLIMLTIMTIVFARLNLANTTQVTCPHNMYQS